MMIILFVGEKRSNLAKRRGYQWEDGRLAAKQLFDALLATGIDPAAHRFVNWFERGGRGLVRRHVGPIVAMGRKVQQALAASGIEHLELVHPAARGAIRKKAVYEDHVRRVLRGVR